MKKLLIVSTLLLGTMATQIAMAASVTVKSDDGYSTMVVKKGVVTPIANFSQQQIPGKSGMVKTGFSGTVQDLGKTISYRFVIYDGLKRTTKVHGVVPVFGHGAVIRLRPEASHVTTK